MSPTPAPPSSPLRSPRKKAAYSPFLSGKSSRRKAPRHSSSTGDMGVVPYSEMRKHTMDGTASDLGSGFISYMGLLGLVSNEEEWQYGGYDRKNRDVEIYVHVPKKHAPLIVVSEDNAILVDEGGKTVIYSASRVMHASAWSRDHFSLMLRDRNNNHILYKGIYKAEYHMQVKTLDSFSDKDRTALIEMTMRLEHYSEDYVRKAYVGGSIKLHAYELSYVDIDRVIEQSLKDLTTKVRFHPADYGNKEQMKPNVVALEPALFLDSPKKRKVQTHARTW